MKIALVTSLLLGLAAAPVFAHGDHDDHGPAVKSGKQVNKDAPASAEAQPEAAKPEAKDDKAEAPKSSAPRTP